MTRVSKRAGTKSLVCMECQKAVKTKPGISAKIRLNFRGKSAARLNRHIEEVHRNRRQIKAKYTEDK